MKYFFIIGMIIAFLVDVFSLVRDINKEFKNKWHKVILITIKVFVAFSLAWASIDQIISENKNRLIGATFGEFGNQKDADGKTITLIAGGNEFQGQSFTIGDQPVYPVKIWADNNQINVDVNINDSKGDGIASLHGRTWKILNTTAIDYNNDDSGFEIITSDKRAVFQINLRRNTVICDGMFCSENGDCVFLDKNGMSTPPLMEGQQRFVLPTNFFIKKIFKYQEMSI